MNDRSSTLRPRIGQGWPNVCRKSCGLPLWIFVQRARVATEAASDEFDGARVEDFGRLN